MLGNRLERERINRIRKTSAPKPLVRLNNGLMMGQISPEDAQSELATSLTRQCWLGTIGIFQRTGEDALVAGYARVVTRNTGRQPQLAGELSEELIIMEAAKLRTRSNENSGYSGPVIAAQLDVGKDSLVPIAFSVPLFTWSPHYYNSMQRTTFLRP